MEKQSKKAQSILIGLLAFLGLGAIGGGGVFIISPTGKLMGMPLSMLKNSPFNSFLIPGTILFSVFGLVPLLLILALIKRPESKFANRLNFFKDMHWSWSFTVYVGFALIIWLQIQMVFLSAVHWLHTFYMFFAVIIIFVALLPEVRKLYRNKTGL